MKKLNITFWISPFILLLLWSCTKKSADMPYPEHTGSQPTDIDTPPLVDTVWYLQELNLVEKGEKTPLIKINDIYGHAANREGSQYLRLREDSFYSFQTHHNYCGGYWNAHSDNIIILLTFEVLTAVYPLDTFLYIERSLEKYIPGTYYYRISKDSLYLDGEAAALIFTQKP